MQTIIGIRREDKDVAEQRAPLAPSHVRELTQKYHIAVHVEPATNRIFTDDEYRHGGATLATDAPDCRIVFGTKEIPIARLLPEKVYCFFSHTIKGQPYNMPMLRHILATRSTLIDYERVVDEQGRRLIFFGRFAGCAGMIRSLWAYGRRLATEGYETPFAHVKRAYHYHSLEEARQAITAIGAEIRQNGLPRALGPVVCGFAGYGNVSKGAQEIYDLLPVREVTPQQLSELTTTASHSSREVYKVVFREEDMVAPAVTGREFSLSEYFQHPERYRSRFAVHLPHLSLLINAIYWAPQYPRLLTIDYLKQAYNANSTPRLRVIGDISCDIGGAIECTVEVTSFENPVYVFDPATEQITYGVTGNGPVILALDRLPNEFSQESTEAFGNALMPFIPAMAAADYTQPFEQLALPAPIKRAVITHQGELTPDYRYLHEYLAGAEQLRNT